jgi:uncharacterized protein YdiU (UPF0061 family)
MNVGFIHGVMNTDNMSIAGETIDFGPCAFMEAYHPGTVFSSIDQHGRYAYANQPGIAQWNLARFAEAILPLLADDEDAGGGHRHRNPRRLRRQLSPPLAAGRARQAGLACAYRRPTATGATLRWPRTGWRCCKPAASITPWPGARLADAAEGRPELLRDCFPTRRRCRPGSLRWQARGAEPKRRPAALRAQAMRRVNPRIIPRNHRVELALDAASQRGRTRPLRRAAGGHAPPLRRRPALARYAEPAPSGYTEGYRTFCGT